MQLIQIDENIWVSEDEKRMLPEVWLPLRMTIVRIGSDLWLHSPLWPDLIADEIDLLGDVRWVVNPNGYHGAWASHTMERWPLATLYSSPARDAKTRLPEFVTLDAASYGSWANAIDSVHVAGLPQIDESVFFHRESKSLIVTDLLFNLQNPRGRLSPVLYRIMGTWDRPAQSRLFRGMIKDPNAASDALEQMMAWDFERVIMAHGDIIDTDAKQTFAGVVSGMMKR